MRLSRGSLDPRQRGEKEEEGEEWSGSVEGSALETEEIMDIIMGQDCLFPNIDLGMAHRSQSFGQAEQLVAHFRVKLFNQTGGERYRY
jgi:hypothetical protein